MACVLGDGGPGFSSPQRSLLVLQKDSLHNLIDLPPCTYEVFGAEAAIGFTIGPGVYVEVVIYSGLHGVKAWAIKGDFEALRGTGSFRTDRGHQSG